MNDYASGDDSHLQSLTTRPQSALRSVTVTDMAYTKLFNSIITSTIWSEDDQTRIVWITFLAIADKHGEVQGSVPGIARLAGVSVDSARVAIDKFLAPDPDSRTKDDEGRRIEVIEGGWLLLNYAKYREMASDADRAEKSAIRQKRFREKRKRNAIVTPESHQIPQAEAEAEADTKTTSLPLAHPALPPKVAPKRAPSETDEEWIARVAAMDCYKPISVNTELEKARVWCSANHRHCTRKFFVNWLSRALESKHTIKGKAEDLHTKKSEKYGW